MTDLINEGAICPYCLKVTKCVDSSEIYGKRAQYGWMYYCKPCGAYVGCHKGSKKALGRLADHPLREAKKEAHHYFDGLWKHKMNKGFTKNEARTQAYDWLSCQMELKKEETHIGMFDVDQCKRVVEICRPYYLKIYVLNGK